jgi:hypothetical protein
VRSGDVTPVLKYTKWENVALPLVWEKKNTRKSKVQGVRCSLLCFLCGSLWKTFQISLLLCSKKCFNELPEDFFVDLKLLRSPSFL